MNQIQEHGQQRSASRPRTEFLTYFGKERLIHLWLADKRTKLFSAAFPPFVRLGLVPDTISYIGLALLAGVALYFVRKPLVACLFLAGNLICDGIDGAYARHAGKASQSGAFTDIVCDQVGMLTVATMAVFHHLVSPLLGMVYIALYLIIVVFGVIINVMGLASRITITSKYFLYIVFGVWAYWEVNYFATVMSVFSGIMAVEVVVGYLRLKRGIRKKFDTPVRFAQGDPYSGRLNYALNVAVPVMVLISILIGANQVPIRAFFDLPKQPVQWKEGPVVVSEEELGEVLGLAAHHRRLLLMVRDISGTISIREFPSSGGEARKHFALPGYFDPAFKTLPIDGDLLLIADRTTHLLMGIDLDRSFAAGSAIIAFTLPMGHLRVTAMATGQWRGQKVWLAANYLYTRKTYLVDPAKALKKGNMLGGVVSSYINGGFPAGMASLDNTVIEFNSVLSRGLLYTASLSKVTAGKGLLDARITSFLPPVRNIVGPVIHGEDLVMITPEGGLFRLPLRFIVN